MAKQVLMCPVCRQSLNLTERTWRCEQGHSYDVAKQGYVNLHVVQHKHSKNPGDTPESVDARRAFLQDGYYQPLQQAVVALLKQLDVKAILDIGCGEGYYTSAMQQVVEQCVGVDIAKNAVQRAAKLNTEVTWVVGTGATLPVLDQSMDACTSLFSPIPQAEIARVLKDEGYLIVVTPASEHLYAMREALFEQVNPHTPEKFVEQLQNLFELKQEQIIDAPFVLDQQALKNLIAMTPYAYKASPERRSQLEQQSQLEITASFQIYVFQKRNKKAI
ncbi:methyltransferase domain-containing protein [Acinetobacter pittii]|uniref:Methyltransferase domain-containing protein n=2 Tax=Acinetobacter TaxID=469 RepID=A0AB37TK46_ACIPI|nr:MULTISPECIES: methyltransferase domain-containing protein [Acinetobacter]MBM0874555.1 methyltransferase domain-containing protein [Acinetobacter pittii]MCK0925923.1 methyltransferase domain-containing protein [Acinetobacter pittii]MCU4618503.1 methyltransferase domain-containing protein [Acinetobacter pittii]MDQ8857888.1 methyltransferase domain-containing protein [Acinetobacter pittii]MDQ8872661.1 methyltransferase domain-containing protein [Acinetobacter pittii]